MNLHKNLTLFKLFTLPGDPGRGALPRGAAREARAAAGGGLQDEQAQAVQPQHVSTAHTANTVVSYVSVVILWYVVCCIVSSTLTCDV